MLVRLATSYLLVFLREAVHCDSSTGRLCLPVILALQKVKDQSSSSGDWGQVQFTAKDAGR